MDNRAIAAGVCDYSCLRMRMMKVNNDDDDGDALANHNIIIIISKLQLRQCKYQQRTISQLKDN